MITVGLTGAFGTGKSFVAGIFKDLGARVIDADKLAHMALKKGSPVYKKAVAVFGRAILKRDGSVDRRALAGIVFNDRRKLAKLNGMIHPFVIGRIKGAIKSGGKGVLVIDAPLICETGLDRLFDTLVVVKASKKRQLQRCLKKFDLEEADVCKRMACQMPLEAKIKRADIVIDNDGARKDTKKQVTKIWQELKKGAIVWR
jgi:dephospho-CoA kinase